MRPDKVGQFVDTSGKNVERITRDAFVVDGCFYPIDCLVFGTGF